MIECMEMKIEYAYPVKRRKVVLARNAVGLTSTTSWLKSLLAWGPHDPAFRGLAALLRSSGPKRIIALTKSLALTIPPLQRARRSSVARLSIGGERPGFELPLIAEPTSSGTDAEALF